MDKAVSHHHLFERWDQGSRRYVCQCGAAITEEAMEAHAPYGAAMYTSRIAHLKKLLGSLWRLSNDVVAPTGLRRKVLDELFGVIPEEERKRALSYLDRPGSGR